MSTEVIRSAQPVALVRLSIVIPTHNRVAVLLECLRALLRQTMPDFEVIVVDNGASMDDTRNQVLALQKEDARIVYLSTTEKGDFVARNIGCRHARTDVILTTDDDWEMTDPRSLGYVLASFEEDQRLGVLGISEDHGGPARQRSWKHRMAGPLLRWAYRPGKITRWGLLPTRFYYFPMGKKNRVDHMRSCCMAFRVGPARAIGFFPVLYVQNGQGYRAETEFCRRIASQGFDIVYSTEVTGWHKGTERPPGVIARAKTPESVRYQSHNNTIFFLRNYWSPRTAPVFMAWDLLLGSHQVPGLLRLVASRRYFGKFELVKESVKGKWQGYLAYRRKYHDMSIAGDRTE